MADLAGTEMLVGVVSDIHCNVEGLRTAVAAMGRIDRLLCLGDSIYDYRFSNEIVAQLREYEAEVIMGNHEENFFGPNGVRARAAASGVVRHSSGQPRV